MTAARVVPCPCCGDEMHFSLAGCWTCYRLSDRLSPGTWPDGNGGTFTLTEERLDAWDAARMARLTAPAGAMVLQTNDVHEYFEDSAVLVFREVGAQEWYGVVKYPGRMKVSAWGADAELVLSEVRSIAAGDAQAIQP